ncbi:Hypothetical protein PHPALM_3450 [Phytophthora palmivora]|uniref:Uncharacterized protein n=1 Tax=Phytophthora palmivora TaxID=4796 RepID=A0A2P4YMC4_9STRA|nr:Hypothetical protein PHPALM_3450 [Phytophthora palmivora]
MVQQIVTLSLSVLPFQEMAEPDFDLAPDLLAVTQYMSPTASPSSAALPPATPVDVDFGDLTLVTPPASSTVRSSGVASPAPAAAESDDDDLDMYGDPDDPYSAASLLRAAENIPERTSLPDVSTRHPSANWKNTYNSEAPIDPDAVYPIRKLVDRIGTPPHLALSTLPTSWEWPENLGEVPWCINQVNAWKASGSDLSFNAFYGSNFRGAGANEKNLCFLYAFQAACYGLGCPGLVSGDHWERFCPAQGNEFPKCVLAKAIDTFLNFVRSCKPAPLSHLEWITKVYALYRVALSKPKHSKKPKQKVGKKTKLSSNYQVHVRQFMLVLSPI